jgi:hypothetical protein
MATKKPKSLDTKETKQTKVKRVISHARESLKLFETIEQRAIGRAKRLIKVSLVPRSVRVRRKQDEKLMTELKSLGLATAQDLQELKERVRRLEAALMLRAEHATASVDQTLNLPRV